MLIMNDGNGEKQPHSSKHCKHRLCNTWQM